jgi:hypothetical protein
MGERIMSLSKDKKRSIFIALVLVFLIVAFFEISSWKNEKDFYTIQTGKGVEVQLSENSAPYRYNTHGIEFELPQPIEKNEALKIINTPQEDLPGDEKIEVPQNLVEKVTDFEKVIEKGTFYSIDETFSLTREAFFHEMMQRYVGVVDEEYSKEEITLHLKGFWKLGNNIYLQVTAPDVFGNKKPIKGDEDDLLLRSPISLIMKYEDDDISRGTGMVFPNTALQQQSEDTWEMLLWGELPRFSPEIRYQLEDTIEEATIHFEYSGFFISEDMERLRDQRTEKVLIRLPKSLPGEEYVIDQRIRISLYHTLYFKRVLNYHDHSAWEVVLETEQDDDILEDFSLRIRQTDGSIHEIYMRIIPQNENNHYLVVSDPIELSDEDVIEFTHATIINQNQFIANLQKVTEGESLFSYSGVSLVLDVLTEATTDLPPKLTLTAVNNLPQNAIRSPELKGYMISEEYELMAEQVGTENIIFSHADYIGPFLEGEGEIEIELTFEGISGVQAQHERFRSKVEEGQINYTDFEYHLKLPPLIIQFFPKDPPLISMDKTGAYLEPR